MRILIALCLCLIGLAPASATDLKLLTAGAYKPVALELVPEFEKKTGHKVTIENDTAGGLAKRLAAGEYFDVIVMPPAGMAQFLGNKVVQSSGKPLVRSGIGVAVKQGAPLPDISTVEAWKQSLLAARAVAYIDPDSGGSSGIYLAKLFEKMSIAEQLKPKSVLVRGGLVAEKVVSGDATIGDEHRRHLAGNGSDPRNIAVAERVDDTIDILQFREARGESGLFVGLGEVAGIVLRLGRRAARIPSLGVDVVTNDAIFGHALEVRGAVDELLVELPLKALVRCEETRIGDLGASELLRELHFRLFELRDALGFLRNANVAVLLL